VLLGLVVEGLALLGEVLWSVLLGLDVDGLVLLGEVV
jgi:hypothetical protein